MHMQTTTQLGKVWGTLREKQSVRNGKEILSIILTWLSLNTANSQFYKTDGRIAV